MNTPVITFKRLHEKAVLPTRAHDTDTGYDLTAVEEVTVPARGSAVVPIGLQVASITPGYWYLIMPRSGLGFKHSIQPHLGVIDNPYRGSLDVKVYNFSDKDYTFGSGDRVAQIGFFSLIQMKTRWSDTVEDTARGEKGFGSTGN